jgi:hypothetical protein
VIRKRADFPAPIRREIDSAAQRDGWANKLMLRASGQIAPEPIDVPTQSVRLYIGPSNYAGQAYEWAHAVERALPTVGARNAAFALSDDFAFPTDYQVPVAVYQASEVWHIAQLGSIEQYTHALIESFTSLLGNHWRGSILDEVHELRSRGLNVAFMCHGTDVRLPSRHRSLDRWSPFIDDERTRRLEEIALRNHALLNDLGGTAFVSTPDLLIDVPDGVWCPVVVDARIWAASAGPVLKGPRPRVVHIASAGAVKGTNLIRDSMMRLQDQAVIDFHMLSGVAHEEMPQLYGAADIVLDQFRIGSYGVAACEAMASGRLVVSHVSDQVRSAVKAATGQALPIVEADPDTIDTVVADIAANPDNYRAIAAAGMDFARQIHDGSSSAQVLNDHLGLSKVG